MPFFTSKKKKHDDLKTLSEKDIQSKLYGDYTGHSETVTPPPPAKKKPAVPNDPVLPHEKDVKPQDLFEPGKPVQKTDGPLPFSSSAPVRDEKPKEEQEDKNQKISEWVKEENKVVIQPAAHPKRMEFPRHRGASSKPKSKGVAWKPLLEKTKEILLGFLRWIGAGVINFFLTLDFRRPGVRRGFYTAGAVFFLGLIFLGIHFLNIQRERAMKMPPKSAAAQAVSSGASAAAPHKEKHPAAPKPVPAAEVQPSEIESKEETQETANSDNMGSYVIQVATYASRDDAERLVKHFEAGDIKSFVKTARRAEGKNYYSVFLGGYENYHEAQKALESFKKKDVARPFQDAFIRTL